MEEFYLIGLARGKNGFFCPVSRFHLVGGATPRRQWPAQAPLTQAVKVGLRSGTLVDVNRNIPFEAYATKSQLAMKFMAEQKAKEEGKSVEEIAPQVADPVAPTAPDAATGVESQPTEGAPSEDGAILTEKEIDEMSKKDLLNFIKEQGIEKEELDLNNRSDEGEIKHALKVHFGHKMV